MMNDSTQGFNLWKLLLVLAHRKFFIVGLVGLVTVVAVIIALALPKWYRAKTSILPSQYEQSLGISGNFSQFVQSSAGFELPIMATPSDVFATMLKSHTIARALIEEHKLAERYDISRFQELYGYLQDKTRIVVTEEGIVELYFEDRDPELAAAIANSYIEHLDNLNRQVKSAKAKADREFIHQRMVTTKSRLDSARGDLLDFQRENKAVDLTQQMEMAIASATELKTRLALIEVELDVQKNMYSSEHSRVRKLETEAAELKRQLTRIEDGSDAGESYTSLALSRMPELSVVHAQLVADMAMQEKVYDLLVGLYEEARIKEQKDTPTIAVLETAYSPDIKHKPKRSLIVMVAFFGSLCVAVFLALFADYLEQLRRISPADYELLNQARREITGKTRYSDS